MNLLTARVFANTIGVPLLRRLLFPYFLVLLLIAQVDASIDWGATRSALALASPGVKAISVTTLVAAWSLIAGRALCPIWRQATVSFLIRQPIGYWEWPLHLLPSLAVALAPVVAACWLVAGGAPPLIHYLGLVGLSLPIIVGGSLEAPLSIAAVGASTSLLALLSFAYAAYPAAAYAALLAATLALPAATALLRRKGRAAVGVRGSTLSSTSAGWALVRRDLLSIVRSRRRALLSVLIVDTGTALMMLACRINGGLRGRDALLAACILLLIGTPAVYQCLDVAKAALGRALLRAHWPISYALRARALLALVGLLLLPGAAAIAPIGGTMGAARLPLFLLFAATTAVLTASLFAGTLRSAASSIGAYVMLMMLHGAALLFLPEWAYAIVAFCASVAGFALLLSGLRAFALDAQGGVHHASA